LLLFFLAHTLKDDVDTTNDSRQINGTVDTDTTRQFAIDPARPGEGLPRREQPPSAGLTPATRGFGARSGRSGAHASEAVPAGPSVDASPATPLKGRFPDGR
jgi:hypothetical protein